MAEAKSKMGRPTIYSRELADTICQRLSDGESLRTICKTEEMPVLSTVMKWLSEEDKQYFSEQYAKAREMWADNVFDELFEIADDGTNDYIEANDPDNPGYRANGELVARSRLRVDTRKWALARMSPKKYGDRQAVDHTNKGDKFEPTQIVVQSAEAAAALKQQCE